MSTVIDVEHVVNERYGQAAKGREPELCCPVEYDPKLLNLIPDEINERDYGCADPSAFVREGDVVLDLGSGAFLPPAQEAIEKDFKRELMMRYGIVFNQLFTITNMPINRFLDYLRRSGNEERYMRKLVEAFNPSTIDGLMCRNLVSVDWTGKLYDCDFNQMLELGVAPELPQTIADFDPVKFGARRIMTGSHCFGCTAGAGSSCGGAVVVSS
jgi:radical SAM/Cys-rich protein